MAHFDSAFPSVKAIARINSLDKKHEDTQFYDCNFYPYTLPGIDPVFAVVGQGNIIVCRPSLSQEGEIEILRWFRDEEKDASMYTCTWSQDPETGDALLCVAGLPPSIKIFNVTTGELERTLIGHGKDINDIAVSPLDPTILASASMDYTVRFWSLDLAYEQQPCMLICGGEGHKEGLLKLAFHPSGRYLLTGGMDCMICLWTIPDLPNADSGTDKPTVIHYPHFSTSAIHTDFVDCVAWYHDLIISKCANENKIVLWCIEGFSSTAQDPPSPTEAPTTHEFRPTRSAWGGTYQRLLQFQTNETTPFFMRFSLFHYPGRRPILVIGNEKSKVFFWDLQALEEWDATAPKIPQTDGNYEVPSRAAKRVIAHKSSGLRQGSYDSETTGTTGTGPAEGEVIGEGDPQAKDKFAVDDPFRVLLPHKVHVVPKVSFAARQTAWSVGGEWMVLVGDEGMIVLFGRKELK